ncbi:hypothetical protein HPB47_024242 [Ixodes persulcatus]|uniref:Uncharacterized protein n=1 Tax=Ixodes persulcatus TaxID=34615 RepID=A0AC60Q4W1_IXOPE|nr:hypothetical protein HPB47_024242 [Ixodes persulcatus]
MTSLGVRPGVTLKTGSSCPLEAHEPASSPEEEATTPLARSADIQGESAFPFGARRRLPARFRPASKQQLVRASCTRCPPHPQPTRALTFDVSCQQGASVDSIFDAATVIVGTTELFSVQHLGETNFQLSVTSSSAMSRIVNAGALSTGGTIVQIVPVEPQVTAITCLFLPVYVKSEALTAALASYGKAYQGHPTLRTGTRYIRIEMKEATPVPNFFRVSGHRATFDYRGLRRVCRRCQWEGHIKAACNVPYCTLCATFGHDFARCAVGCGRCGAAHATVDCTQRRTYSSVAGRSLNEFPALASTPREGPPATPSPAASNSPTPTPAVGPTESTVPSPSESTETTLPELDVTTPQPTPATAMATDEDSNSPAAMLSNAPATTFSPRAPAPRKRRCNTSPRLCRNFSPARASTGAISLRTRTRNASSSTRPPGTPPKEWKPAQDRVTENDAATQASNRGDFAAAVAADTVVLRRGSESFPAATSSRPRKASHPPQLASSARGTTSSSRLDRVYVTETLASAVQACGAVDFPPAIGHVSDHRPVLAELCLAPSTGHQRFWRLDSRVLRDPTSRDRLKEVLRRSLLGVTPDPANWDHLLETWRVAWVAEGRALRQRQVEELRDTSLRIRIVRRGGAGTPLMRGYLSQLLEWYQRLLRASTTAATVLQERGGPSFHLKVLRYTHRTQVRERRVPPFPAPPSTPPPGQSSVKSFSSHFEAPATSELTVGRVTLATHPFLHDLPKVPPTTSAQLFKPPNAEEVHNALLKMKTGSAPGPDGFPTEFYRTFWDVLGAYLGKPHS